MCRVCRKSQGLSNLSKSDSKKNFNLLNHIYVVKLVWSQTRNFLKKGDISLRFLMLINKLMRYAEKMGLDPEELLQMTVLEASLLIEEIQTMWVMLEKSVE